jgi:hypothetical protein
MLLLAAGGSGTAPPKGESEGEDKVVMLAGRGGIGGVAVARHSGAKNGELAEKLGGGGEFVRKTEGTVLEQEGEIGDELAFGNAVGGPGDRGGVAGGDEDGDEIRWKWLFSNHFHDRGAGSGGVNNQRSRARDFRLGQDSAHAIDDGVVGGVEGETFEEAEVVIIGGAGKRDCRG